MDIPGEHQGSNFLRHIPCDVCGSRDNAALYDDGHTFCFGCEAFTNGEDSSQTFVSTKLNTDLIDGVYAELTARGIKAVSYTHLTLPTSDLV